MLSEKTYEVIFRRKDRGPDEHYLYLQRGEALGHFRLFFSQDSEELYRSIEVRAFDWKLKEETLLGMLAFEDELADGTPIRKDWRNWPVGRKTFLEVHESDGDSIYEGTLTEKHDDHAIVEADGMRLWVDDDTLYMFR